MLRERKCDWDPHDDIPVRFLVTLDECRVVGKQANHDVTPIAFEWQRTASHGIGKIVSQHASIKNWIERKMRGDTWKMDRRWVVRPPK